jgi:hypothetical protein
MNKISKNTLALIKRTIDIADANDIEHILFANKKIRGHSIENGIFILQEVDQEFEFPPLALTRLATLKKRLALVDNITEYEAFYVNDPTDVRVVQLILKSKRTKIEFRCANPDGVRCPIKVSDPVFYSFDMDADTVTVLNRVTSAMGSEVVTFYGNKKEPNLLIKVQDNNKDVLEHMTESPISWDDDCDTEEFSFIYSSKKVARLLRDSVASNFKTVKITRKGLLITPSNGINVYTVAEI